MKRTELAAFAFTTGICLLIAAGFTAACNEAICASVVSKCMLTQSCKCDLVTCSCCKECFSCLSYLYDECCSCVDLCPKPNMTDNPLNTKSHVEDFKEPLPGLFHALTAEPDATKRWTTFTFPVEIDMSLFAPKPEEKETTENKLKEDEQLQQPKPNMLQVNCTVAYMADCNSWNKCRASCQSMGATSYRWFHDGCCECIGDTCINYGINESRCSRCPLDKEQDMKEQYDDYGQEDEIPEDELD